jgi:hypothetical protein
MARRPAMRQVSSQAATLRHQSRPRGSAALGNLASIFVRRLNRFPEAKAPAN